MQQLTYIKKNHLEWRDAPEPRLHTSKEAIVRPIAASRCDGDRVFLYRNISGPINAGLALHYLDPIVTDTLGRHPYRGPIALGHECVAEVIECGSDVQSVAAGDRVVVPWSVSCGECHHCGLGLTSKCSHQGDTPLSGYGFGECMGPWGGMVSDAVRVPFADAMLVRIPEDVDPIAIAAASDNLPDAWRTIAPHLKRRPNAPVLVVGGGARSIGLYAVGMAVALGAERCDYVDTDRERLEIAEALGGNPVDIPAGSSKAWLRRNAPRGAGVYPISVDASASAPGLNYAIRSLAPGGICTSVGYYFQRSTKIPFMHMFITSSTLHTGISHPRASIPEVLELVESGRFRPELVTTLVADWQDAPEAYLAHTTKVVLRR